MLTRFDADEIVVFSIAPDLSYRGMGRSSPEVLRHKLCRLHEWSFCWTVKFFFPRLS